MSRAFNVEMAGFNLTIEGPRFEVDGAKRAVTALRIVNSSAAAMPTLAATGLVARNAYRATQAIAGGDGIYIGGLMQRATLIRPEVYDCFMAPGAEIFGSQGIFGLTVAQTPSAKGIKHIVVRDARVCNVWSEDPNYINDQDGIRIFQDMADPDASCLIDGYKCENVANRAVKLHSAPNATIQNVWRILDNAVVPQVVDFTNPDIDAQQASAVIRGVWVHYKGRCHTQIVRAVTDRADYYYGGSLVDGVSGLLEGLGGAAIVAVGVSSGGLFSRHRVQVRNISLRGPIANAVSINVAGDSTTRNYVSVSGVMAEVTVSGITMNGSGTAPLHIQASDMLNTGAAVPLTANLTGPRTLASSGITGFT